MIPKEHYQKAGRKNTRSFELELYTDLKVNLKESVEFSESGVDNRTIHDDGRSQNLSEKEILALRDTLGSSTEIVNTLVANSTSFASKTEYSQAKYLKKKEKKYFEYVQIRRPTLRLLSEIYYRIDADKVLGLRMDSLTQIISYSGVCNDGNYLLYDSGSNGLLPAGLLNSMGSSGTSKLVYLHPGNFAPLQGVQALNFEKEHEEKCITVNLYSVLRQFYQKDELQQPDIVDAPLIEKVVDQEDSNKRKHESGDEDSQPAKKICPEGETDLTVVKKIPKWQIENAQALEIMTNKVDALIVASREHPMNIVKELLQFVQPSRPIVIFGLSKEILMECYGELKQLNTVTNLRLVSNWMRMYQVLPNRTHPVVSMQGNSGFIMFGTKVTG